MPRPAVSGWPTSAEEDRERRLRCLPDEVGQPLEVEVYEGERDGETTRGLITLGYSALFAGRAGPSRANGQSHAAPQPGESRG